MDDYLSYFSAATMWDITYIETTIDKKNLLVFVNS